MNANAITPSCAIENGTPVDFAITPVAAAVPGPHTTSAAVPTNSAATLRTTGTSAMASLTLNETLFGDAERRFGSFPSGCARVNTPGATASGGRYGSPTAGCWHTGREPALRAGAVRRRST